MEPGSDTVDVRARAKEGIRLGIAEVALRLFVRRGFDEVTTAEIARDSGISSRSFFRYFATKEDAALAGLDRSMLAVRAELAARPGGESVWVSLQHAFAVLIDAPVLDGVDPFDVARLFVETPSLRARRLQKHGAWRQALLPLLVDRLPDSGESWRTEAASLAVLTAALGCVDTATEMWVAMDGRVSATTVLAEACGGVAASTVEPTGAERITVHRAGPLSERQP